VVVCCGCGVLVNDEGAFRLHEFRASFFLNALANALFFGCGGGQRLGAGLRWDARRGRGKAGETHLGASKGKSASVWRSVGLFCLCGGWREGLEGRCGAETCFSTVVTVLVMFTNVVLLSCVVCGACVVCGVLCVACVVLCCL